MAEALRGTVRNVSGRELETEGQRQSVDRETEAGGGNTEAFGDTERHSEAKGRGPHGCLGLSSQVTQVARGQDKPCPGRAGGPPLPPGEAPHYIACLSGGKTEPGTSTGAWLGSEICLSPQR